MDKSPTAATPLLTRRRWLGGMLALSGSAGAGVEVASLAGAWDHRADAHLPALTNAALPERGTPRLFHVGHSCHLIELSGQRWLTDPWLFNPAFGSLTHATGIGIEHIGPLDGIFISHRHPDHFDAQALRHLDRQARVWTPDPSLVSTLREIGFASVSVSNAWQTEVVGAIEVSFAPAVHDVPEHSLMLAGRDARVLFCGDTGAHEHWGEIRRRYRPSTALLPCDGTALRWEPRQIMNPEEAADAARQLGSPQILQTHADATYTDPIAHYLLSTSRSDSVATFRRALARENAASEPSGATARPAFQALVIGETRALVSGNSATL
jgi:L-ascorbate metabolism protein UlaG (beta-lactamase superfamily)